MVVVASNFCERTVEAKPSNGCKYWCRDGKTYYCCSNGRKSNEILSWVMEELFNLHDYFWFLANPWPIIFQRALPFSWSSHDYSPSDHVQETEGTCPEIRPFCPRSNDWEQPPIRCDTDNECYHMQKCCYDVCLDHKTCKSAVMSDLNAHD
jgi:hypothetical protein